MSNPKKLVAKKDQALVFLCGEEVFEQTLASEQLSPQNPDEDRPPLFDEQGQKAFLVHPTDIRLRKL